MFTLKTDASIQIKKLIALVLFAASANSSAEVINVVCTMSNSNVSTKIQANTDKNTVKMGNTPTFRVDINDLYIKFSADHDGDLADYVINRETGDLRVYLKYGIVVDARCRKPSRKF